MDDQENHKSGVGPVEAIGGAIVGSAVGIGGLMAKASKHSAEIDKVSGNYAKLYNGIVEAAHTTAAELYPKPDFGKIFDKSGEKAAKEAIDNWSARTAQHVENALADSAELRSMNSKIERYSAGFIRSAFSEMSWKGKTALGVAAVGAGLAAGYLINKWRDGGQSSEGGAKAPDEVRRRYRHMQQALSAVSREYSR